MASPQYLIDGPATAPITVILAHGAGAPMDSRFMDAVAGGVVDGGLRCVRFEFPYMVERRTLGIKKPPNRMPVLLESWRTVIDDFADQKLLIGGKSLGGRAASMIVAQSDDIQSDEIKGDETKPDQNPASWPVVGLCCLGYPFHPPGKPEVLRLDHFSNLRTPSLIVQGTRDSLGSLDEVSRYPLPACVDLCWLEDGDHSFKPRKKSGRTEDQNWQQAITALVDFARKFI